MGASVRFVTPEEHEALKAEVVALTTLVTRLLVVDDVQVSTAEAMRLTGIKSANTLRAVAQRGDLTAPRKTGRSVSWSRNACILYANQRIGLSLPPAVAQALKTAA